MYSYIRGPLAEVELDHIVIDVNGIGYNLYIPTNCFEYLPGLGEECKIHTYLYVREDAMMLYGFLTKDDLELFKQLISVSGIGPKGALGILSALSADDLRFAILAGDAKAISKAPGIGAKTAKKLILELKDKFHLEDALEEIAEPVKVVSRGSAMNDAHAEAVQALTALGYSNSDALKAVKLADGGEQLTTEELLKAALKQLAFL